MREVDAQQGTRPTGSAGDGGGGEPQPRRALAEQILVVLSLSLLESAIFALISLLEAPIKGVAVSVFPTYDLARQLAGTAFALAPVWLVLYLVRRPGEGGVRSLGLDGERPWGDLGWAVVLAAAVGAAGLGLYLGAVQLGVNRIVVPVPPEGHWWTVPVLALGAGQNALLEEVVVVGYLLTRLPRLGWSPWAAIGASAALRGSYHLYQGWGGFAGNVALGLLFGWVYRRTGRLWPLVAAHLILDAGAGVLYLWLCPHAPYC